MENLVLAMAPNSKSPQMITINIRNHLIVVKIVKNVAVPWILIYFKNNVDIVSMIWMYQLLPHPLMPQMYEMGHYFSESLNVT